MISDEVYEHLVYDGKKHVSPASLPGMWERTITVGSAGKSFSCTGWKIGWAVGPAHLVQPIASANQWVPFCVSTPAQEAVARMLALAKQPYQGFATYYDWLRDFFTRKRDALVQVLDKAGLQPIVPEGGYFVMADTSRIQVPASYLAAPDTTRDYALCRWLTAEVGVSPIPPSAFYVRENKHLAQNYARFAFCKKDEDIQECGKRLMRLA